MQKATKLANLWLPVILWTSLIFAFSSISIGSSSDFYWKDFVVKKTAHLGEYAVLAMLLFRALINSGIDKKKAFTVSILVAGIYGLTDEFHQSFTPGREPRMRDVIIDTIGATIGAIIWKKRS